MLHFSSSLRRPARDYLSRREQWRLLLLILPLGLVIVVLMEMRDPETAERVDQIFAATGEETQPAGDTSPPRAFDSSSPTSESVLSDVRPKLLRTVRDNSPFRNAEQEAWFHLLAVLQRATTEELAAVPQREVGYVQLVDQPHAYRGRLVTVRGEVREVTEQTPAANDLGVASYYRVVIQPADSSDWPIFVYSLEMPAGISPGDGAGGVTVTGFFFKNLSYRWQDGLGIAPVVLAKQLQPDSVEVNQPKAEVHEPFADDTWTAEEEPLVGESEGPLVLFRDMLALAGWGGERLAEFDDGAPLSDEQRPEVLHLLRRLRTLDAASLEQWTRSDFSASELLMQPEEFRGELLRFDGHVRKVVRHPLGPRDSERLEMRAYYECEMMLDDDAGAVSVLTARVPRGWLRKSPLDEPATMAGMYVKRIGAGDREPAALLVAAQIAPFTFGRSALHTLGMDVGLLDGVRNHRPIWAEEREAFYQMLDAVGRVEANQLLRAARRNVDALRQMWSQELRSADLERRLWAREVVSNAREGRYSVVPLFNDADRQVGELFAFDGVARRVLRVETGISADGGPSDVVRRFGIDHYYEMYVFTDDSQNRPLVFCVRELPAGFPTGGDVRVPVRVAGFFFKSWRYHPRDAASHSRGGELHSDGIIAPVLIGRMPIPMETPPQDGQVVALLTGGVVLLTIAGIWAAVWWWGWAADRRFRERRQSAQFSLPPGQSLDDLIVPDEDSLRLLSGDEDSRTHGPT